MATTTGTRILTARGEVPVEALREGDAVETAAGDFRPVVFLGHRRVDCARHPRPREVWPVRVRADAFADGVPGRDLLLSPDHAVFIDDILIPLQHLINGSTIAQEAADEVVYWHVELPEHAVLFAESLPCESHKVGTGRTAFANGGKVTQLHPRFAEVVAEPARPAARALTMIRRYLLDRTRRPEQGAEAGARSGNVLPG
jgi:hypothetical protein